MQAEDVNTRIGWTTDAGLAWGGVHWMGVFDTGHAVELGLTILTTDKLNTILHGDVISTLENKYPGTIQPWKGVLRPQYPVYLGLYKEKPTGEFKEFTLHAALGLFVLTAPLRSPAVAKLHDGDSRYYRSVCSDGWVRWLWGGVREEINTIHYTYPGGERRRFKVTYTFRGAAKHMVFRTTCQAHLAVFMDAMLGTDIAPTVMDMHDHPEKYAPAAFTRRVRARTTDVV